MDPVAAIDERGQHGVSTVATRRREPKRVLRRPFGCARVSRNGSSIRYFGLPPGD